MNKEKNQKERIDREKERKEGCENIRESEDRK